MLIIKGRVGEHASEWPYSQVSLIVPLYRESYRKDFISPFVLASTRTKIPSSAKLLQNCTAFQRTYVTCNIGIDSNYLEVGWMENIHNCVQLPRSCQEYRMNKKYTNGDDTRVPHTKLPYLNDVRQFRGAENSYIRHNRKDEYCQVPKTVYFQQHLIFW